MDKFKKISLNEYGWELCCSHEYGKKKIQRQEKKRLRKLSRTRLKRNIKGERDEQT